jgi:superfamily II DNA or RNA helicase
MDPMMEQKVKYGMNSPIPKIDMSWQTLSEIRGLYFLPADPLSEEVLIPGFQAADRVDCMVGFFSSAALASLAPGLATYIASSINSFRLIISPLLSQQDLDAIEAGFRSQESVAAEILESMIVTEDRLKGHTLKCLSYLLRTRRIEIKIALMNAALFHPKVWLFGMGKDVMAVHGSSNATLAGISKNIEQVAVSKSWEDPNQRYVAEKLSDQFYRLWEDKDDSCFVIPLPEAIERRLLKTYSSETPPTEDDLRDLYRRATGESQELGTLPTRTFAIPSEIRYDDGPFEHQGKAVAAWANADFKGILEMATGSGKTITSMIGAYQLFQRSSPLLIVVAAPYVPLIEQWCDEITPFGLRATNLTTFSGVQKRNAELQRVKRRLASGNSLVEIVVISHDTLCTSPFLKAVEGFTCARLLIADEVHNLGSPTFIENTPDFFEYRLGLSATPVRQYDQQGTDALFAFFGDVVFRFTLEEAIGRCLVEYDYYVHPVYLSASEIEKWFELSQEIQRNSWRDDDGGPDPYLAKLFRERRLILEMAEGKLPALDLLLARENPSSIKFTLVYATDKGPTQLQAVNDLLRSKGVRFHQLTAEETANRKQTKRIIDTFQNGDIQVLTAKRVLDEGVNIPQIQTAYVLASTTVERQWIQRRGRLLRTCGSIGKTHSTIHDFLALPPDLGDSLDKEARALIKSELRRAQEFARLARNAARPDGPLPFLDKLVNAAYL